MGDGGREADIGIRIVTSKRGFREREKNPYIKNVYLDLRKRVCVYIWPAALCF